MYKSVITWGPIYQQIAYSYRLLICLPLFQYYPGLLQLTQEKSSRFTNLFHPGIEQDYPE